MLFLILLCLFLINCAPIENILIVTGPLSITIFNNIETSEARSPLYCETTIRNFDIFKKGGLADTSACKAEIADRKSKAGVTFWVYIKDKNCQHLSLPAKGKVT